MAKKTKASEVCAGRAALTSCDGSARYFRGLAVKHGLAGVVPLPEFCDLEELERGFPPESRWGAAGEADCRGCSANVHDVM